MELTRERRRTGWRQFLSPGWVITAVLVAAFAYVAFTVLAPWQLGKNSRTQAANHRLEAAFSAAPVDMATTVSGTVVPEDKEWTKVTAQGSFRNDVTIIVRNRPVADTPAYQVLTPFTLTDGRTIMVNRGWVPASGGVPEVPAAKDTQIQGFLRLDEPAAADATSTDRQITAINAQLINREGFGVEVMAGYVQLDQGPIVGQAIPLPQMTSGPYLSYGIQWIIFGFLAPIGLGYFVFAEIRERRRAAQEDAEAAAEASTAPATDSAPETPEGGQSAPEAQAQTQTQTQAQTLSDRYGDSRGQRRAWVKRASRDEERF